MAADDWEELLARAELFRRLDRDQRAELARQMREVDLPGGKRLFSRGDPGDQIFIVASGRIRLSVLSPEGRELSFSHAIAGDVIGEIAALDGGSRSADATAIADTRLLALPQPSFLRFLETHPAAAMGAVALLCRRIRELSEHAEAIALHAIDVRFARLLLDLADSMAASDTSGEAGAINLEISQGELALMAGSTRQRANAALMSFERIGAIRRDAKSIVVDRAKLLRIAQRRE